MHSRGLQPSWWSPRRAATLPALIVVVALVTACGSSGGGSTPTGPAGPEPSNQPQVLSVFPPDVPTAPACAGSTDVTVSVAPSVRSLASACESQSGDEMVVTNLSIFALDIGSANNASPYVTITPADATAYPPAEQLEVDAETLAATGAVSNGVASGYLAPGTAILLPVGGQLDATTSTPPIQLTVQVDADASEATLAAGNMSGYTVDSFTNGVPEDIDSSYAASIAECAIAAYSLWNSFSQPASSSPSPPSAADVIQQALETIDKCQELYKKLSEDPDANPPADEKVQPDLATKAEQAGADFELKSEEAPREPVDLFER